MWFKKKPKDIVYKFPWEGKLYPLKYPEESFTYQYNLMTYILKTWINQEWMVVITNPHIPHETQLLMQFTQINMKSVAKIEYLPYLANVVKDGTYKRSFSRFMEAISLIHISCDQEFLDVLKARFYKSHVEYVYGHTYGEEGEDALPTRDEWIECSKQYPWVWLLPHVQVAFSADSDKQGVLIALRRQQLRT